MLKNTFVWSTFLARLLHVSEIQFNSLLELSRYIHFSILPFFFQSLHVLFGNSHSLDKVITSIFLLEILITRGTENLMDDRIFSIEFFATATRRETSASFRGLSNAVFVFILFLVFPPLRNRLAQVHGTIYYLLFGVRILQKLDSIFSFTYVL